MLEQIKRDLAASLNCSPNDIILLEEGVDPLGRPVRRFRYQNWGWIVTTNLNDDTCVNVDFFDPNAPAPGPQQNALNQIEQMLQNMQTAWYTPCLEVDAANLPNSTESVRAALNLQGWQRGGRVTFGRNTIRTFFQGDEYKLTVQNDQKIIDITNKNYNLYGQFNDNLRAFLNGQVNGEQEHDINLLLTFLQNNEEEFIFGALAEIVERDPTHPLAPILRDVQKLLRRDRFEVGELDASTWDLHVINPCEATCNSCFRLMFTSISNNPNEQFNTQGIEFITD